MKLLRLAVVALGLSLGAVSLAGCEGSCPRCPTCRVGCRCGRSCISCADTCRMNSAGEWESMEHPGIELNQGYDAGAE